MGIKFPDAGAKRVLKLSKRSAKVRKALDKSHLRDLKSKKSTSKFNKIDHAIESRKADNEDVEAQRLFYEEMGISADEAEDASEGEAYEKLHKGSFRNVDKSVFENNKKVAKLPVKFDDKVVPQEDVGDDFDVADLPDDYMEVNDVEVSDAEVMSGAEEDEDSEDVDDEDAQNEDIEGGSAAHRRGKNGIKEFISHAQFVAETKVKIACLCQNICEDPETNIKQLTDLVSLLNRPKIRKSSILMKLLLLSICEVIKDVVPGYKIRELTSDEKKVRVKKEVKKLRTFEELMLRDYQSYLKHMECILKGTCPLGVKKQNAIKGKDSVVFSLDFLRKQSKILRPIVAQCTGSLLTNISHFNYRTNLVRMVCTFSTSSHKELAEIGSSSISQVFENDRTGQLSLEIMFYLDKILVSKAFTVHSCCLKTFLSLPITEVNYEKIREFEVKERREKLMRKQKNSKLQSNLRKKASKIEEKWVRELDELNLKENKDRINFVHGKIIGLVFACYFRVLKRVTNSKNLEVVLEGVAKLGHLIGVEFYDDLLVLIKDIMKRLDLNYKQRLHCVLSVFRLMSGCDMELVNVDLQQFYSYLYESLLALSQVNKSDFTQSLNTIEEIVLRERKKDMRAVRMLALSKRLCTVMLSVDNKSAIRMFNTINKTIISQTDQLLSEESVGSGKYCPYVNDPDLANVQNTALWELHPMRNHYCAQLVPHVKALAQLKTSKTTQEERKIDDLIVYFDRLKSKNLVESVKAKRASLKDHNNLIDQNILIKLKDSEP